MTRRRPAAKMFILGVTSIALLVGLSAQVTEHSRRLGFPQDWSHRHVVFTTTELRAHPEIANLEPRAMHQILRRARAGMVNREAMALRSSSVSDYKVATSGDWEASLSVPGGAAKTPIGSGPAKYTFNIAAPPDCVNDYVVFPLNAAGVTGGQATMIAFNGLYTGPLGSGGLCPSLNPSIQGPFPLFSYNTSTLTNGKIVTAPAISLDGTKIAFIESSTTASVLHVLTFDRNDVIKRNCAPNGCNAGASVLPGSGNAAHMVSVQYAAANNTRSSPWVDYVNDTIYVGADNGNVYKITGVFKKPTPTVLATGGWPITIRANSLLTSPILDSVTQKMFLGDNRGILYSVSYVTPGPITSVAIGQFGKLNAQITDAPILDSVSGVLFTTSSNDGTSAVIVESSTSDLSEVARVRIGQGSTNKTAVNLYDGDFDNNYYNGAPGGFMLVCGTGPGDTTPYRYHLGFSGIVIQPDPAPVQIVNSTTARCGTISEFFNPNIPVGTGTDFFFWGVTNTCVGTRGCIMSLNNSGTVTTASETGGTSGVIVDNDSTLPQASNIYFGTLGTQTQGGLAGPLAIKVQQNGLN